MKKIHSTGVKAFRSFTRLFSSFFIFFILFGNLFFFTHAQAAGPEYGGRLTFLGEVDVRGFDAIKTRSLVGGGRIVARLVMDKLFSRGENGELLPGLGLSAVNSKDGKTWTIVLRQGVKFHDNTPFNVDAVVHHWKRILNPENRFRGLLLIQPIVSVEKTKEFEVRFHLKHAWTPFTAFLTNPSGFSALIPSPTAVENGTHNLSPVGTGPFVFKEWKRGDYLLVAKNSAYWQKGKPYLDEVVFKAIPDHGARYATLASGQADLMITDRAMHVKKLEKNPEFTTYLLKWRGASIITMNNMKPPLDDVRVRRAIALGWDQKQYIRMSFKDIVPHAEHWFGDAINCKDVGYPAPDLEKARQLIQDYGKPVALEYIHTATNRGKEAGVIMQQMMKKIGVKITPVPSDYPGLIKRLVSKKFDMTSWGIPGAYDMGPITTAVLHSKSPWNVSRYTSQEMDKTLMELRRTTDPGQREKIMCRIARKVNSETVMSG
ncbi:MAG: hypothetical protein HUN05_21635 [Desulfobacter sp.]|nr:MAG: hypothetical protein HUN05_21635 [Desulfobacter sp.]